MNLYLSADRQDIDKIDKPTDERDPMLYEYDVWKEEQLIDEEKRKHQND